MWKKALVLLAALALSAAGVTQARSGGWLAARLQGGERGTAPPSTVPDATIDYGRDPLQRLDVWKAQGRNPAPLVMFVHGGGWKRGSKANATSRWAPTHYPRQGYVYAAIDYRLVPTATVEQQGEDMARALRALLDRAPEFGIDRHRVVLMGHSAGAHLVALAGTDERYLRSAGLGFADVDGVIAIDGAAYDVPAQMRDAGPMALRTYGQAFGDDPARQRALSPAHNAGAPNAPAFLLLYVQRPDGVQQAQAFGRALEAAGTAVEFGSFPGTGLSGHAQINRELGNPDYAATPVVDAWLRQLFGP
jgi:acetyl esterase/lipase